VVLVLKRSIAVAVVLSATVGICHSANAQAFDAVWRAQPTHGFDAQTTFAVFGPLHELRLDVSIVNESETDWIRIDPGFFGAVDVRLIRGDTGAPVARVARLRDDAFCSATGTWTCPLSLGVELPPARWVRASMTLEPVHQAAELEEGDYYIELDFTAARAFLRGPGNATWRGRFRSNGRVPVSIRAVETTHDRRMQYSLQGSVALLQDRDFRGALEIFTRFLKEFPGDVGAYGGAGTALLELGRFDEAVTMLERAMTARPGDAIPARRAAAYVGMGQENRARTLLERYVPASDLPAELEQARQRAANIRARR
jgi:tetratricopeptide (TPR) repeat protein